MKLFLLLLLVGLTQPGNDPQKLLNALEEKLASARSVQITFDANMESNKQKGTAKGTLTFAPKGKARADLDMDLGGKPTKVLMVSDGTKMATVQDGKKTQVEAMPAFLPKALITLTAKTGIMAGMMFGISKGDPNGGQTDPLAGVKYTDFKLGKVEKINGKDAQIIEYQLTIPSSPTKLNVALWLDVQTTLPVKRQITAKKEDDRLTLTETYSVFRLNADLDAKMFELPK